MDRLTLAEALRVAEKGSKAKARAELIRNADNALQTYTLTKNAVATAVSGAFGKSRRDGTLDKLKSHAEKARSDEPMDRQQTTQDDVDVTVETLFAMAENGSPKAREIVRRNQHYRRLRADVGKG